MRKISNEIWQQYEDIRAEGKCNMLDKNCVFGQACKKGYLQLAEIIQSGDYIRLISGYETALKEKRFERRDK